MVRNVSPQEAKQLLDAGKIGEVWDTRKLGEWRTARLPSARSMPHSEVIVNIEGCGCFVQIKTPRDTPILVYGDERTVAVLERNKFTKVYFLVGGLEAWRKAGLTYLIPIVRSWKDIRDA